MTNEIFEEPSLEVMPLNDLETIETASNIDWGGGEVYGIRKL